MTYLINKPSFAVEFEQEITRTCAFPDITYLRIGEIGHLKINDVRGRMLPRDGKWEFRRRILQYSRIRLVFL